MPQLTLLETTTLREASYAEYRDKPRQRIAEHSACALSNAEILACIIGSSTAEAERVLTALGGWVGLLQADYAGYAASTASATLRQPKSKQHWSLAGGYCWPSTRSASKFARPLMWCNSCSLR